MVKFNLIELALIVSLLLSSLDNIRFVDCVPSPTVATPSNLSCDFENGTCGWFDWNLGANNKIDWVIMNDQSIDPGLDHTREIRPRPARFGKWLYTKRQTMAAGNNSATLMSITPQPSMNGSKCLTFWFYMFGRDAANFSLIINTHNSPLPGQPQLLWLRRQPHSNKWIKAQVTIPPQTVPYYLMFRASLWSSSRDVMGLDDITYTDGPCPPNNEICDFEVNSCKWTSATNDFIRTSAAKIQGIPTRDHTIQASDGYYLKVNTPNKVVVLSYTIPLNINATHKLPNTFALKPRCLKFWYYFGYMGGTPQTSNDYFNISATRNTNIDGMTGLTLHNYAKDFQWIYGRVSFNLAINEKVSIKAHTSSPNSVIAFDDIQVQNQFCESPGSCDFENDMCGWSNGPPVKGQILWIRNSGETKSSYSGPTRDHTINSKDGWYLYVPEDAQANGTALLESEILGPYTRKMCFSFYYLIMSESNVVSQKLTVQYYSPTNMVPQVLAKLNSDRRYIRRWNNFNVTLNNLPQGRLQFQTIVGNTSKADVAIDDISVRVGACGQSVSTPPPTTPEPSNTDKQWDKILLK